MTRHLEAGQPAPEFSLTDATGTTYSSRGLAGNKVILYFYPKAATPGCTTEACDFRDSLASLAGAGYQVIGVSPDDAEALQAQLEESDPADEDPRMLAAAYYDFLTWLQETLAQALLPR